MHNQKYPINSNTNSQQSFQNQKQMRSSFIDPYSKNQVISPANSAAYMKASMLNNYENKKSEKTLGSIVGGFESPRASYSSSSQQQSSQQYIPPPTGVGFNQQVKDLNGMGKSCIRKQSNSQLDLMSYIKEIEKKIVKISQTLYNHQVQLNDKSQWSGGSNSTGLSDINFENLQRQIASIVQQEMEKQLKRTQNILYKDIERLRIQIKSEEEQRQIVQRQQFDFFIKKLEQETYALKKQISKDFSELRQTNITQRRNLFEVINKEFESKLNRIHEANKEAFRQIQTNFMDIKQILQNLKCQNLQLKLSIEQIQHQDMTGTTRIFISNKKFQDPIFIRYKQIIQKLGSDPQLNVSRGQILLNEVNYYVDRQGYLLDRQYRYLVDKNNKQIQFRQKHLNILKMLNILK